jgi:hypothetical protein
VFAHIDGCAAELHIFALQEFSLERRVWLADKYASAGAKDAVPGNSATLGARGHGAPGGTGAAGQFETTRQVAVGEYATARNLFNKFENWLPACHFRALSNFGRSLRRGERCDDWQY